MAFWVCVWTKNIVSLSGKRGEDCEGDDGCVLEVRWRGWSSCMLGMVGRRCKLWWSGIGDGVGGVGVMVKEELCDKVVEVRRVSDDSYVVFFRGSVETDL